MNFYTIAQQSWQLKTIEIIVGCIILAIIGFHFLIKTPWASKNQYDLLVKTAEQRWQSLQHHAAVDASIPLPILQRLHHHLASDELMTITTQLASRSGLMILTLHPSTQHNLKNITTDYLSITTSGNFQQIIAFYQALLDLPYFLVLSEWQLTSMDAHPLKLKLLIEVYHY